LTDLAGATVMLSELRGQVVVVNFWASWCKPCKRELMRLDQWNRELDGRPARIVAVSIDSDREKAARFIQDKGLALPVFHDGPSGLAAVLDLPSLPCTVVLDAWGRVVRVRGGGDDDTVRELRHTVEALLENRPASVRAGEVSG
jgi:thiol-disulfide isomerase/thioredoxin